MNDRLVQLTAWLKQHFKTEAFSCTALAGDASFRRYFRVGYQDRSWIAMDAPPHCENVRPFIAVLREFARQGVTVPEIVATDTECGFLLLSDLGDALYLNSLTPENTAALYRNALEEVHRIQSISQSTCEYTWPCWSSEFTYQECALFDTWFLKYYLPNPSKQTRRSLQHIYECLAQTLLEQPQVCVHRDYHSRNLMHLGQNKIGVLDFQDALWGPVTYDVVSLLRAAYIDWPEDTVTAWSKEFYTKYISQHQATSISFEQWSRWFDLTGLQRHLKILGIFTRLNKRDNKPQYLNYIPRVAKYISQISNRYPEFRELSTLVTASTFNL